MRSFSLAAMKGAVLWVTVVLLPVPILLVLVGVRAGSLLLWFPALFMALVYAVVWFYMRPRAFEISDTTLELVFPTRRLSFERATFARVETLSRGEFRDRYGIGYRIGAGGLFGGFGTYKTKDVTFQFYVSRMTDFVVIHRADANPLLLTPVSHREFAGLLELE